MSSVTKISLDHFRVPADVGRKTARDDAALGEHEDAIAQRHDEFHVVLNDHECRAPLDVDRLQPVTQARQHGQIDAAGRFIEQGKTGARYECHCGVERKSTRLNSSHQIISYAVFCLKKKKKTA